MLHMPELPLATSLNSEDSFEPIELDGLTRRVGSVPIGSEVTFAWLEITGNCQEACDHCYAESGPNGNDGRMTVDNWKHTIDQLSERGTDMVQFIGGEPTLHPGLGELIGHTLRKNMEVEVFSNLVHVRPEHWAAFKQPGVQLATSYYSADPTMHREITKANTHNPIRKNIRKAVELGIPLRAGVIGIRPDQDVQGAVAELIELGVDPQSIGVDYMRQVGRGVGDKDISDPTSQLCGNCADGVVAVMADGQVQPCVFSRQPEFTVGNVRDETLPAILSSERFTAVRGLLVEKFARKYEEPGCRPTCAPNCSPSTSGKPDCGPTRSCGPLTAPKDPKGPRRPSVIIPESIDQREQYDEDLAQSQ